LPVVASYDVLLQNNSPGCAAHAVLSQIILDLLFFFYEPYWLKLKSKISLFLIQRFCRVVLFPKVACTQVRADLGTDQKEHRSALTISRLYGQNIFFKRTYYTGPHVYLKFVSVLFPAQVLLHVLQLSRTGCNQTILILQTYLF